jgi:hypothetical protein
VEHAGGRGGDDGLDGAAGDDAILLASAAIDGGDGIDTVTITLSQLVAALWSICCWHSRKPTAPMTLEH